MSEIVLSPRGEVSQAKDMLWNFLQVKKDLPLKPRNGQRAALAVVEVFVPGAVRESGIIKNPERIAAVNATLGYLICLNDAIDFAGANRPELHEDVEIASAREKERRQELDDALSKLPDGERERAVTIVSSALKEVALVERDIREIRDTRAVRFDEADRYRGLVNAINVASVVGLTFGPGDLDNRLQVIPDQKLSIEAIEDKYHWIIDSVSEPLTGVERPTAAMYNLCQAIQIDDDWHGQHIDALLRIPGYASAAIDRYGGDRKQAHGFLNEKRGNYKKRAYELGLNRVSIEGVMGTFAGLERVVRGGAKIGHSLNESLREKVGKKIPAQRESSYILRRLDQP